MKKVFNLIVETADSMNTYLEQQFTNDVKTRSIEMKDIALRYTTDIISSVAFGIQVNSFDPKTMQFFEKGIYYKIFCKFYYQNYQKSSQMITHLLCFFFPFKSSKRTSIDSFPYDSNRLYVFLPQICTVDRW